MRSEAWEQATLPVVASASGKPAIADCCLHWLPACRAKQLPGSTASAGMKGGVSGSDLAAAIATPCTLWHVGLPAGTGGRGHVAARGYGRQCLPAACSIRDWGLDAVLRTTLSHPCGGSLGSRTARALLHVRQVPDIVYDWAAAPSP